MEHYGRPENWDERMKLSLLTLKRRGYFDCPDCGHATQCHKPLPKFVECGQCGLTIEVQHAYDSWLNDKPLIPSK